MVVVYGFEWVMFLYVDYKGGLVFVDCINLLHSVGFVMDLILYFVDCVFILLWVEFYYCEWFFVVKGVKDFEIFDKLGDFEILSSFVFVIDEFVVLV